MKDDAFLSVRGRELVNAAGDVVRLRGFGLGGWMNMENFITGYPGNEEAVRDALRSVLGDSKYDRFFDRFLDAFFGEKDAAFIQSWDSTCCGFPSTTIISKTTWRHSKSRESGFKFLDRVIELCASHGSTRSSTCMRCRDSRISTGIPTTPRTSRCFGNTAIFRIASCISGR
jgi:hypothetical protein